MIPVYGASEYLLRNVRSILKFTPQEIPIHICDDASPGVTIEDFLKTEGIATDRITFHRRDKNLGFLKNCNQFFSGMRDTNIILVNSDVLVSVGWFDALMQPIEENSNVATVTAMTNHGSLATVKLGIEELPGLDEISLEKLNMEIISGPKPAIAEIPVGVGHCILITAKALEVVGNFDPMFNPGYGEEVDFSIRATQFGFQHYLANTVVTHFGSKTFGEKSMNLKSGHDVLLNNKHPNYLQLIQNFNLEDSQIEAMFLNVLTKYRGLKLLIDARLMNSEGTGTSRLIENTILALSKITNIQLTIIIQEHDMKYWENKFSSQITVRSASNLRNSGYSFDVVYSPSQISEEITMFEYKFWARRVIILQLDLIALKNWKYFASIEGFNTYRNAALRTFNEADAVLYISKYVMGEAQKEFNRNNSNDTVIYCGIDHFKVEENVEFEKDRILVIGAGFSHKNQMYAVKIMKLLKVKLPNIKLVFVGPKPTFGFDPEFWHLIENLSSEPTIEYHRWLSDEELKDQIRRAQIILYPTTSEGFGFIPFEAARMHRVSIFNLNTSLAEFFEGRIPSQLEFSTSKDAETIYELLTNNKIYESQLRSIREIGEDFTWAKVGIALEEIFEDVIQSRRAFRYYELDKSTSFIFSKVNLLKYVGSRKLVLSVFPYFSKRRENLIALVYKLFF